MSFLGVRAARAYIAASLICDNDQERRIDVAGIRTLLSITEESNKLANHLAMTGMTGASRRLFPPTPATKPTIRLLWVRGRQLRATQECAAVSREAE